MRERNAPRVKSRPQCTEAVSKSTNDYCDVHYISTVNDRVGLPIVQSTTSVSMVFNGNVSQKLNSIVITSEDVMSKVINFKDGKRH